MNLPKRVRLVEVGPRDGLQNEPANVPTAAKVSLIESLVDAGLRTIECGSFVAPARVPSMADTKAVFQQLQRRPGVSYAALVPNLRGFHQALECHATEIAVFAAASETFSRRNIGAGIEASLERYAEVARQALTHGLRVRGYVSCVCGCPYEGDVRPDIVHTVATQLLAMGCYEISLGDTIGAGNPAQIERLLNHLLHEIPAERLAVHFHDTWGLAIANVLTALQMGVQVVDSSVAGLGGCPYAPGATGNVATEDVLCLLDGLGIHTGAHLAKVAAAGQEICNALGRPSASKAALALQAHSHPSQQR